MPFTYYFKTKYSNSFLILINKKAKEELRELSEEDDIAEDKCPVCQLEVVEDHTALAYLLLKFDITEKSIQQEMKEKYSTLENFRKETKDKK